MRNDSDLHRDWLGLLDTDGPFLSVPALKKAWPTGMPAGDRAALDALRDAKPAFEKAWDVWDMAEKATADQAAAALAEYQQARDAWVDVVLRTVLGWKNFYLTPASVDVKVHAPDYSVTVSPTGALTRGDMTGALVLVTDPVESLRAPLDDGWAASPIDRMEELLRASGVRVGVVTDGRWWAIVSARPETMVASGITDSQRWIELPVVRDAFINLLRLPRTGREPGQRTCSPRSSGTPSPPPRRSPKPSALTSAAPWNSSSRHCRSPRSTSGAAASPTRCPPAATTCTRPPSR